MSDINELYHQVIVDHGRHPRHFGPMAEAKSLRGHNPLCGDELVLHLKIVDECIVEGKFEGHGCAISMASASLMLEALQGKTLAEAETLFTQFHTLLIEGQVSAEIEAQLGKLYILHGVAEYPSRIKCATLAWHTLHGLLQGEKVPVSTEGQ